MCMCVCDLNNRIHIPYVSLALDVLLNSLQTVPIVMHRDGQLPVPSVDSLKPTVDAQLRCFEGTAALE